MRFLVDECTGPSTAAWLRDQGHDVFSVFDEGRGASDEAIIAKALKERRFLITNDKDFGAKAHRDGRGHHGIVLLRLQDERPTSKIQVLEKLLRAYSDRLSDAFLVVTESKVKFARK